MRITKTFLACSHELADDLRELEIFVNRKNIEWGDRGVFLALAISEEFLDAVAETRLQDVFNQATRSCDICVMLYGSNVSQYTEEEFETAFGQFKITNKPFVFIYFNDVGTRSANKSDLMSLRAFQKKLDALGYFSLHYEYIDVVKWHFNQQLNEALAKGFIGPRDTSPSARADAGAQTITDDNEAAPFEAYAGHEPYVFVSYAHSDARLVFPELARLRGNGYRIYRKGVAYRCEDAGGIGGLAIDFREDSILRGLHVSSSRLPE